MSLFDEMKAALTEIGHSLVCAPVDYAEHNARELLKAGEIARRALTRAAEGLDDETVERVAHALFAETLPDAVRMPWDKLLAGTQETYRRMARAAISALTQMEEK